MRARVARRWNLVVGLLTVATWLGAAILFGAGVADADVDPVAAEYAAVNAGRICDTLDAYPTVSGVVGIGQAIVKEGYLSFYQAGQAIAVSVVTVCPRHRLLMQEFISYGQGRAI